MKAFATLLDALVYAPQRNAKLRLLGAYFGSVPDPDRGYALAALTDSLSFGWPVRRVLLELVSERIDAELFRLSRDYVGDTAETVALIWPEPASRPDAPPLTLSETVDRLRGAEPRERGREIGRASCRERV